MHIDQIMKKDPSVCTPHDPLNEAARIMWEHDCGFVPVVSAHDTRELVGVITDRDICMAAYTRGAPLQSLRVSEVMTTEVATCQAADSVRDAESHMKSARVRRLPVVNDEKQLVGVVSLADLARQTATMRRSKTKDRDLTETAIGDLMGVICEPHPVGEASTA